MTELEAALELRDINPKNATERYISLVENDKELPGDEWLNAYLEALARANRKAGWTGTDSSARQHPSARQMYYAFALLQLTTARDHAA